MIAGAFRQGRFVHIDEYFSLKSSVLDIEHCRWLSIFKHDRRRLHLGIGQFAERKLRVKTIPRSAPVLIQQLLTAFEPNLPRRATVGLKTMIDDLNRR